MSGKRVKQIRKQVRKEGLKINRKLLSSMMKWSLKDRLKYCFMLIIKKDLFKGR